MTLLGDKWGSASRRPLTWASAFGVLGAGSAILVIPFMIVMSTLPMESSSATANCIATQFERNGLRVVSRRMPRSGGEVVGYSRGLGTVEMIGVSDKGARLSLDVTTLRKLAQLDAMIEGVAHLCLRGGASSNGDRKPV